MNKLTFLECSKKKLDQTYLVVYAIKNEINLKKVDYIEKTPIYSLVGVDLKGIRQFLNIYVDRINNTRFWLDCFETLKSRGLQNILFLSVDDNRNMKRCAKIAFPEIMFIDSITYIVPNFYKHTVERDAVTLASKIHSLYTLKTLSEFKEKLKLFEEIYNNSIHQKLILKYFSNVENTYKYSQNIRLLLFKHSLNMRFYDKIRVTFNSNNNYISNLDELYSQIGEFNEYFGFTSFRKKEWTLILNDLITLYPKIDFI